MHKGTSGHKKALNRYQELAVDRSGDPSPNKMKEADEKQKASEKFLKKDNPKVPINPSGEKEVTRERVIKEAKKNQEKKIVGEGGAELYRKNVTENPAVQKKKKERLEKMKREGKRPIPKRKDSAAKMAKKSPAKMAGKVAGMVAKKAGQKAAAKGAKKATQAVADKQGIDSPAKMGSKSPTKAALKGKQHNLPEDLKAKIKASPAKNKNEGKSRGTEGKLTRIKQGANTKETQKNTKYYIGTTPSDSTSFYNKYTELKEIGKKYKKNQAKKNKS